MTPNRDGPGPGVPMACPTRPVTARRLSLVLLGATAALWSAPGVAQEAGPALVLPVREVSRAVAESPPVPESLRRMGQPLERLAQQNDALPRENMVLPEQSATPFPSLNNPGPLGVPPDPLSGTGSTGPTASGA